MWFKTGDHEGTPLPKVKIVYDYFDKMLKLKYSGTVGYIGLKYKKEYESTGEESSEEPEITKSKQAIKKKNDLDDEY